MDHTFYLVLALGFLAILHYKIYLVMLNENANQLNSREVTYTGENETLVIYNNHSQICSINRITCTVKMYITFGVQRPLLVSFTIVIVHVNDI